MLSINSDKFYSTFLCHNKTVSHFLTHLFLSFISFQLDSFGEEPKAWAAMLPPILTRFVRAFDGEPDVDFWSRVCHYQRQGSGQTYLSGWITQRFAYGQAKANGRDLNLQGLYSCCVGVRCLSWFWIKYPIPLLTVMMYL